MKTCIFQLNIYDFPLLLENIANENINASDCEKSNDDIRPCRTDEGTLDFSAILMVLLAYSFIFIKYSPFPHCNLNWKCVQACPTILFYFIILLYFTTDDFIPIGPLCISFFQTLIVSL